MLLGISYRTSVECPECKQQVPVNHLRPLMLCSHCQATTDRVRRELAWWLMREAHIGTIFALTLPDGEVETFSSDDMSMEFFRGPADCPACHRPMTQQALVAAASDGTYRCECGFACACRAAEPSLVQSFPYARWLLGEAPAAGAAPDAAKPILAPCMGCGAGLKIDGASSRTVECSYCNASNYLPDGLWLRLHPAPRLEWFRLVVEIDEASLLEVQRNRHQELLRALTRS